MSLEPTARLLIRVLGDAAALCDLPLKTWNDLLPCARLAGILPRLATDVDQRNLWEFLPDEVHWHLRAERQFAEHFRRRILWELDCLKSALAEVAVPLVLLKGAAYLAGGLPPTRGRVSTDVDLLVPQAQLLEVEQKLQDHGWQSQDEKSLHTTYYLRWLHELPPMAHRHRHVILDLHHNILPLRDPIQISAESLIEQSVPLADHAPLRMLSPADQILHSAAHLFRIGEFNRGLRDLCDMHELIIHYSLETDITAELVARAGELNLGRPCYLAFRYLEKYFDTPFSPSARKAIEKHRPTKWTLAWYDKHIERALFPIRLDGEDWARARSLWLLDKFPLPRMRSMLSPLFWIKRLPVAGAGA